MMTPTELHDAIVTTANAARGAHQSWRASQHREAEDTQWRDTFLLERGRLSGILWVTMGMHDRNGHAVFSHAVRQASAVATGGISIDELLADPHLAELQDVHEG